MPNEQQNPARRPPKFQLQERPTKRISVNDALTQDVFSMTKGEFESAMDNGDERKFLEAKIKGKSIESRYWLGWLKDRRVEIGSTLDEFDRSIFDACVSAQQNGDQCITLRGIWRAITGNTEREIKLSDALKKEILERVDRLACIRITVDLSDACEQNVYRKGMKFTIRGSLLPSTIVEAYVNGQLVDATVKILDESPLVTIAKARGAGKKKEAAQIVTFPTALLDVPKQRNTPTTVTITNYLVRRVEVAKIHPNTTRTILFSTLLSRCGLADADRFKKRNIRKIVENVMKSLLEKNEIKSFELIKVRDEFSRITFNFPPKS